MECGQKEKHSHLQRKSFVFVLSNKLVDKINEKGYTFMKRIERKNV